MDHQPASVCAAASFQFPPPPPEDLLNKPSQQTTIFHIKTFSPFARLFSPSLQTLTEPISPTELLAFIDGLNTAFLSSSIFQAEHMKGGRLLGNQILPAQAVGGVFQVVESEDVYAEGLVVKIMSTKKMMAAIGFRLWKSSAAEWEVRNSESEIEAIEYRMQEIRFAAEKELGWGIDVAERYGIRARMESDLADLERRKG
ncbi:hypothetical protein NA56DRAFT_705829 [Hyaloscypha hepaticicola]|uniref:Uncharacterized protein n=1 Tax=Hyaloscypha hepaticicola TaxID=2082293 RepID=A0A2J6PYW8_9HELO|nr:hypothetical protein NA56DRAFT_705829 [Hyaloscypha hepaticicola]